MVFIEDVHLLMSNKQENRYIFSFCSLENTFHYFNFGTQHLQATLDYFV